ncbi:MAG: putative methyltransferase [Jatrophihabitans sp.]|nr:putative methyltransferase [Jatrophihabitans sp.]
MSKSDTVLKVKGAYAAGARQAGVALSRLGVMNDTPPSRDNRLRHWAYSLTKAYDSLAIAELDVPWWTYRAIDVVDSWLSAHPKPIRVYEYGSGASTLWLSRRADEVYTVEHHRGFAEHIAPTLAGQPNIHMRIVEPVPSSSPVVSSQKEGNADLDFADYVNSIDAVDGAFSLIVIDGRAREACLRAAIPRLDPDGLIVFDNTRRRRYREAIAAAGVHERVLRGLTPTLPYADQTSLITL